MYAYAHYRRPTRRMKYLRIKSMGQHCFYKSIAPWRKRTLALIIWARWFREVEEAVHRSKCLCYLLTVRPVWNAILKNSKFWLACSPGGSRFLNYLKLSTTSSHMMSAIAVEWRTALQRHPAVVRIDAVVQAEALEAHLLRNCGHEHLKRTFKLQARTTLIMCKRLRRLHAVGSSDSVLGNSAEASRDCCEDDEVECS